MAPMTDVEKQALLSFCQQAMLADGAASSAEQQALHRAAERLGVPPPTVNAGPPQEFAHVLAALRGGGLESTAFEFAWVICAADGPPNAAEHWFLEAVRGGLGISAESAKEIEARVGTLIADPFVPSNPATQPGVPPVISATPVGPTEPDIRDMVQSAAIMAGALELLPHSLATLGIVPVQMRLVYRIGKAYGFELDSGHIREFLAVAGAGMASQMVEGIAERVARGLFGGLLGGLTGRVVSQATGSGVAFASTYAVGELAKQYYAGGRRFSSIELRQAYDQLLNQGRSLQSRFAPNIRSQADRIDPSTLASLVRG